MNSVDLKLLAKAYQFASFKHRHQKRKNIESSPYINHPIEVVNILAECDVTNAHILCGAVLHDTLEDTETTEAQLEKEFGKEVLKYVEECSDDKKLGKVQRKINQIQHSLHISNGAKYIKIADKISNNAGMLYESPKGWSQQRVFGYFLWSQAVFKNLEGDNQKLNAKMKAIFQEAGVYKLNEEERKHKLEEYYAILRKSMEA